MFNFNQIVEFYGWTLILMFIILAIWSVIWKGLALWKSARLGAKWWFIVMLVVNTAGVLEILYIYIFSRKKETSVSEI